MGKNIKHSPYAVTLRFGASDLGSVELMGAGLDRAPARAWDLDGPQKATKQRSCVLDLHHLPSTGNAAGGPLLNPAGSTGVCRDASQEIGRSRFGRRD